MIQTMSFNTNWSLKFSNMILLPYWSPLSPKKQIGNDNMAPKYLLLTQLLMNFKVSWMLRYPYRVFFKPDTKIFAGIDEGKGTFSWLVFKVQREVSEVLSGVHKRTSWCFWSQVWVFALMWTASPKPWGLFRFLVLVGTHIRGSGHCPPLATFTFLMQPWKCWWTGSTGVTRES